MLIERKQDGTRSLFELNSSEGILDFPERIEEYWDGENDWRFGSYRNAEAARSSIANSTPSALCTAAYEKARQSAEQMTESFHLKSVRRRRVYDESGDEVAIDRYLEGHSSSWGSMRRPCRSRAITVGLMMWMTCGNADSDFAENVAAGVAMAEMLKGAGYQVRILAIHTAHMGDEERGFTHPLVETGKPIDEHGLMSWGQPATCRHVGFSWMQHLYQSGEMGCGSKTSEEWLRLAGVDIFMAKQWDAGEQISHVSKVLDNIQRRNAA